MRFITAIRTTNLDFSLTGFIYFIRELRILQVRLGAKEVKLGEFSEWEFTARTTIA